jgi:hypothetical protein
METSSSADCPTCWTKKLSAFHLLEEERRSNFVLLLLPHRFGFVLFFDSPVIITSFICSCLSHSSLSVHLHIHTQHIIIFFSVSLLPFFFLLFGGAKTAKYKKRIFKKKKQKNKKFFSSFHFNSLRVHVKKKKKVLVKRARGIARVFFWLHTHTRSSPL